MFTSDNYTATTPNVSGFIPMANNSLQYLRQTSLSSPVDAPQLDRR